MSNKRIGELGEKIARFYLQINDFEIIKINFRCKFGEIDIIARKGNCIHFVEVKTRTNDFIEARIAIDKIKKEHIWKCAEFFIYKNQIKDKGIQFDAIEVYIKKDLVKIQYLEKIIEK